MKCSKKTKKIWFIWSVVTGFHWGSLKYVGAFQCCMCLRQHCEPQHQWLNLWHWHWLWNDGQSQSFLVSVFFCLFFLTLKPASSTYSYNELQCYQAPKSSKGKSTEGTILQWFHSGIDYKLDTETVAELWIPTLRHH